MLGDCQLKSILSRIFRRPVLFDETGLSPQRIKSLRLVIWGITFGTVCFNITGVGGIAMTGYLKSLEVSDFVFGMLSAVTPAVGVVQILASYIMERTRKRKLMFMLGGAARMLWLPFGLVPFFVPMAALSLRIWILSLFLILTAVGGQLVNITYQSLLADIIPNGIRGSFLSTRGRISTIMGILGGFLTAWLLDNVTGLSGYAFVFGLAALLGSIDISMFFAVEFPPMPERQKKESMGSMISDALKNKQFLGLAGYVTIWHFAINLSNPFYLVYTRMSLGLSNTTIMLIAQILPNICSVIILSRWGNMLDKRGIRHSMQLAGRLSSIAPLLWLFVTPGPMAIVLIIITYISTGLLLPGMDVGAQTAILNRSPDKNRSMYIAVYHFITTLIGNALAHAVGGWLLDNPLMALEKMSMLAGLTFTRYNYLFLLTFILRMISAYMLLPRMISPDESAVVS